MSSDTKHCMRSGTSSHVCTSAHQQELHACRQGQADTVVTSLTDGCPSLPDYARKGVLDLVYSRPDFYPMPSWTHLSQLHGPKVGMAMLSCAPAVHTSTALLATLCIRHKPCCLATLVRLCKDLRYETHTLHFASCTFSVSMGPLTMQHFHSGAHDAMQVLLLGDAAHTMSPVLGQGLNSGLEDVAVFAQCLEQHQGDVDAALPAYNVQRLPDIQAIMTMNEVLASSDAGLASQVTLPYWLCSTCCPSCVQ